MRRGIKGIVIAMLMIGGGMNAASAAGATYYVDRKGGTQADFASIQAALDADLEPGDRVVVKAGVYHERLTVKRSGKSGAPIIIEGERGPKGEWLTIIDGSVPVPSDGWSLAPEFSPNNGVYRRAWPQDEPFCMVVMEDGEPYDLAQFAWVGGQHDAFKHINLPADQLAWGFTGEDGDPARASGLCGQPVKYWDGIEAGYHYRDGYLYLRFRDGDDPSSKELRWSPGQDLDGLSRHDRKYGAGFLVKDQAYVVIRDFRIRACQHGVMIQGEGAHHNVVDSCSIANGQQKVLLEDKPSHNRIENCVLTEQNLRSGPWMRGPWGGGSTYAHGVSGNYYYRYKQEIGSSTDDPRDAGGIKLVDFGSGNIVAHNEIYNVNCGVIVAEWAGPDLRIFRNHLHDIDKGVMAWPTPDYAVSPNRTDLQYGIPDLQVYDNLFQAFFMALRPAGEPDRFARVIYFYRNRMWAEPGVEGRAWYIWEEGPAGPHEYYLYNNSFSGGQDIATWRAENCRYVNNIISSGAGLVLREGYLPRLFDYNWCGGDSTKGETWPANMRVAWETLNEAPQEHNRVHEDETYWPDAVMPDFRLSEGGIQADAIGGALDLSRESIGDRQMPGFVDSVRDMGAVACGEEPPVVGPLGVALDRTGWTASASQGSADGAAALDFDYETRWTTGTAVRTGTWFAIDMGANRTFGRILLDATGSRYEFPPAYEVYVSDDGRSWGEAIARGTGTDTVTTITFGEQIARHIKVVVSADGPRPWSIHEFRVYRNATGATG